MILFWILFGAYILLLIAYIMQWQATQHWKKLYQQKLYQQERK